VRISRRHRESPDVNLTPLIDVVFLLLIFFMVSTTFERESELGIELPKADSKAEPTSKAHLDVGVDAKGHFFVNAKPLVNTQRETLLQAIRKEIGDGQKPPVVVSADGNAPHQSVMLVLDVAQELNLVKLRFATRLGDAKAKGN
jgi:biopolymer transport protein ExbD